MNQGEKVRLGLLITIGIVGATALGCLIYGFVVVGQGTDSLYFAVQASPMAVTGSVVAVVVAEFLVAGLGFIGTLKKERTLVLSYLVFAGLFFLPQLGFFVYVLLAGNGVFAENTARLAEFTEQKATIWTIENPQPWIEYQDLNLCCGLEIKSTYNSADGGFPDLPPFTLEQAFSGRKCVGNGIKAIEVFHEKFPVYNETTEKESQLDQFLRQEDFLCYENVVRDFRSLASSGGYALGVLVFFKAIALSLCVNLLYSVKVENGGLKLESSFLTMDGPAKFPRKRPFSCMECIFGRKEKPQGVVLHYDN